MSDSVVSHWVSLNQAIIIKGQKEGAAPETTPLQNSTHTFHGPNCWQILSTFSSRFLYFKLPPQLLSLYPSSFLRAFLEKPRLQCINITAAATGPAPCRRRHRIPHRARPVTVSLTNRTISFFAGRQRKNFARWSSRAHRSRARSLTVHLLHPALGIVTAVMPAQRISASQSTATKRFHIYRQGQLPLTGRQMGTANILTSLQTLLSAHSV